MRLDEALRTGGSVEIQSECWIVPETPWLGEASFTKTWPALNGAGGENDSRDETVWVHVLDPLPELEDDEERDEPGGCREPLVPTSDAPSSLCQMEQSELNPEPALQSAPPMVQSRKQDEKTSPLKTPRGRDHTEGHFAKPAGMAGEDEPDSLEPPGAKEGGRNAGRSRIDMEDRYRTILRAFAELNVRVHRPEGEAHREGPGFYVIRVKPGRGVNPERVMKQSSQLKLKLGLEATQEPRTYIDRGAVIFEIPKRDEERYYVTADELWECSPKHLDRLYTPLGEDIRGDVVGLDFSSSDIVHLLIAGQTGSGKSVALETLLYGLCRGYSSAALRLHLVDPKGTELADFALEPHVEGEIGFDAEDAIALLERMVDEMERRYARMKEFRVRSLHEFNELLPDEQRMPWRLVVLDEYADLVTEKDERKKIEQLLKRLAQKARASGIHVILATQKPSAEVLNTTVRSNLTAQLALRTRSAIDSRIIMEQSGAETLAGKGDAFLRTGRGVIRLQCAMVQRED